MIRYRMIRNLNIEEVHVDSEEFCFEYIESTGAVQQAKTPVSIPPILFERENRYLPIRGKNELMRHAHKKSVVPWALLVEGFDSVLDVLLYSIEVKLETGGFSVVEKSLALKRLYSLNQTLDERVYERLGLARNSRVLKRFLSLTEAPADVKDMVHNGTLHENTVFTILDLEPAYWTLAAKFISKVALGTKKRNEILVMLREISQRDGKELRELIESDPIQTILNDMVMDSSHIGDKLYRNIRELRYPSIHAFNKRFNEKLREVKLDRRFQLHTPENFERWEFKLVIPFASYEEFKENVHLLLETGNKPAFKELMNMRY